MNHIDPLHALDTKGDELPVLGDEQGEPGLVVDVSFGHLLASC